MPANISIARCVFLTAALFSCSSTADSAPDPLLEFLGKYRCAVADRLQRLYDAGDPAQDRDRFIVVSLLENDNDYVQCRFHDHETTMLCEASSRFYMAKPGTPNIMRLAPDKIAALGHLGFSTDDRAGNFQLERPVAKPPDFGAIADLILKALYVGYDARVEKTLRFEAPFAPGMTFACDPVG